MFVTPYEAGTSSMANSYSAYLLGHRHVGRTPAQDQTGELPAEGDKEAAEEDGASTD
ncbi:hypothetical protein [Nonomuraea sp. NPDC050691]|uniref:hypothetical protein n=1 Tax=Nonomuraea sp. NPDC050691 TaxID=3155661 RepID=UPI0033C7DC91